MKSATRELLLHFERKGIPYLGDPYIHFEDGAASSPVIINSDAGAFGLLTLVRVTAGDRWLVQWLARGGYDASRIDVDALIAVLEGVVWANAARPS
jgi:hypothetical protein